MDAHGPAASRVAAPDPTDDAEGLVVQHTASLSDSDTGGETEVRERTRNENALRESEALRAAILDSALDCIICIDAEGRITEFNPAAERTFGHQRGEVVGMRLADVIVPASLREAHRLGLDRYLATGDARVLGKRVEMTAMRFDGSEFPVELAITRIPVEGPACFAGYLRDISERKKAEEAQTRRAHQTALRVEISSILAKTDTLRGVLQACTEAMARHLELAFAQVWTLAKGSRLLELQASAGLFSHVDGLHGRIRVGELTIGRIAQDRTPHLTNDLAKDPWVGDPSWAGREAMVGFAGYPLLVEDAAVGVVAVLSRQVLAADTLDTLASLADSIAQRIARQRADEELRRSEAYLAEGQRLSKTGSWGFKVPAGERFWSREVYRIYGFDPTEGPPVLDALRRRWHPEDRLMADAVIERAIRDRCEFQADFRLLMPDGVVKHLHTVGHPVLNDAGEVVEVIGTVMDVTARKIAERQLHDAIQARFEAVLSERTRVAREMHDGLLQDAMGIALYLRAVLPDVRAASEPAASELLRVVHVAEKTVEEARQAIMAMRSAAVDEDLVGALERAVRRSLAQAPLAVSVAVTGQGRAIDPDIRDAAVRIVQEAAANVARHADARTVKLDISFRTRRLRISLVDDGKGFDPDTHLGASAGHFGLVGMRERAAEVSGSLEVRSVAGAGTTVTLRLPYQGDA
jgi:PAS domain S-box-containing protein